MWALNKESRGQRQRKSEKYVCEGLKEGTIPVSSTLQGNKFCQQSNELERGPWASDETTALTNTLITNLSQSRIQMSLAQTSDLHNYDMINGCYLKPESLW